MYTACLIATIFGSSLGADNLSNVCGDFPDVGNYTLRVTAYDPMLGGINCMEPCDRTATGRLVSEWYGRGASCPTLLLQQHTTVSFAEHEFKCIDTGGGIIIDHDRQEIRVDILWILHNEQGEYYVPPDAPYFIHTKIRPPFYTFYTLN